MWNVLPPIMPRSRSSTVLAALIGVALGAGGLAALADPPRGGFAPDPPPRQSRTNWVFELSARDISTGDPSKLPELPPGTNPQDAAAWTMAARVLLNLDETISKK